MCSLFLACCAPKHTLLTGAMKFSGKRWKFINFIMISVSPSPLILFNAIELQFLTKKKKLNLHENACFWFFHEISIFKLIASTLHSQQILTNSSNFHVGFMFKSANFHLNTFTGKIFCLKCRLFTFELLLERPEDNHFYCSLKNCYFWLRGIK